MPRFAPRCAGGWPVEQLDLLRFGIDVLERLNIVYMVVGSYASGSYGEPRFTQDIDIVLELAGGQVDALCDSFPPPDFYVSKDAAHSAVKHRSMFNVIHADSA